MSKKIRVSISPQEVYDYIRHRMGEEIIYEEFIDLGNNMGSGTVIFEKYYMRASNRASLTVLIQNFSGVTEVTAVPAGSSQGLFFSFDWGAGDSFVNKLIELLSKYQI